MHQSNFAAAKHTVCSRLDFQFKDPTIGFRA